MKLFNLKILEAVNRGILIALDDFDVEEPISSTSPSKDVVDVNTYIHDKIKYEKLIQKFIDQIGDSLVLFCSKLDLADIAQLSKKLGLKYKVTNTSFLQDIIKTVCRIDKSANLNWIDTSEVTNFGNLFNMTLFHGDISEWDTHNVKNMYSCFAYSQFNGDISRWDVSNVENMDWMFLGSWFNKPIDTWDVSNVTSMNGMFSESHFNLNISKWNVTNCKNYIKFNNESTLKKSNMPPKFRK